MTKSHLIVFPPTAVVNLIIVTYTRDKAAQVVVMYQTHTHRHTSDDVNV